MTETIIKKQAKEINMLYKVNEEQETEINRLKMIIDIKDDAHSAIIKDNLDLKNDLQQATNEIKLLNKQLDRQNTAVNDLTDIVETSHKIIDDLKEENKELKFRIKMLIKVHLNSVYGLCNVLDNTKETKDNDDNN